MRDVVSSGRKKAKGKNKSKPKAGKAGRSKRRTGRGRAQGSAERRTRRDPGTYGRKQKQSISALVKRGLSPLEAEASMLLEEFHNIAQVGRYMGISYSSARRAVERACVKLGLAHHAQLKEKRSSLRAQLLQLAAEQGYRCALTGRKLTPEIARVDHIKPVSMGGGHEITNLQIVHEDVNTAKGTLTQAGFIQLCKEVAEWTSKSAK